jgi:hypothetical protein
MTTNSVMRYECRDIGFSREYSSKQGLNNKQRAG